MLHLATLTTFLPTPLAGTGRRSVKRSIRRAYAAWSQRFPRWANSGFDEYFLLHDALPLLADMLAGRQRPDPAQLARTWVAAYGIPAARARQAVAEMTPVAADFLTRLQIEYCGGQPA